MEKEISRMLTLSTAHISRETAQMIEDIEEIVCYNKADVGWLIYVPEDLVEYFYGGHNIPLDLWSCMLEANINHCAWLCLDRDGEIYEDDPILNVYKW